VWTAVTGWSLASRVSSDSVVQEGADPAGRQTHGLKGTSEEVGSNICGICSLQGS